MSSLKSCVISSIVVWLICITPIQTLTLETTENFNEALRQERKEIMCPTQCYCTEDKTTQQFNVDCSNRQLQNIPDLPPQTTRLDLSLNNINKIQSFFFSNLTQLSYLDLSYNKLCHIFNNTFYGMHSLKWLSLMRNNLIYLNSTFELDAFNGLDQLEVLHLECNSPSKDNIVYPDQAISKLKNLREINIDGYPVPLGPGFRNLEKLEGIFIRTLIYCSYCNMGSAMPDNFFENIVSLRPMTISLSVCYMSYLPPRLFSPIRNLRNLDISKNRFTLKGFKNGSKSLSGSNIEFLNLHGIEKDRYVYNEITRHMFHHLKNTPLKYLDLSVNRIYSVEAFAFRDLPQTLEYLSLKHNVISKFDFLLTILFMRNLKTIDLSFQTQYRRFRNDTYLEKDKNLEFGSTNIGNYGKDFCEKYSAELITNNNVVRSYKNMLVKNIGTKIRRTFYLAIPPNLEVFISGSMKVEFFIPAITFLNNTVLRYMDYSNNMARCWGGPMNGLPALQYLDLSENYCTKMSLTFFKYLTNITTLLLQDNVLGISLANDISGIAFSTLTRLETLNISGNTITSLSRNVFEKNTNLKYLNLSRNELTDFDIDIKTFNKIEVIDLTSNLISGFSDKMCQDLKQQKAKNTNLKIRIQSNRLMCTCEYLSFVHLLITQPDIFDSVGSINCTTADVSNLSHDQLATFYPQLMKSCVSQEIFIGTLVTFFIVLGIVLLSAMFYYNRWKFAYLYYIGSKKLHIGNISLAYKPVAGVFITYEQEPEFIFLARNVFIPRLIQNHVTYVNGEDDFPAGPQQNNIAGAIVGTRKTLILLSRDIFEDRNRELEMNLAIMHEMNCSDRIIVPVFVGHFPVITWPVEIVTYIRNQNHRCLLYEDTEEFWEMLINQIRQ
ncbi:toll-like receptor 4 [Physella acuta]|uniref:toll-like receptor 4 n=1 Tax=Physella acuta TaxID=109671 RepID=UPI0027DCD3D3|nr:toll-like receptor 4 [Physella acuta]